MKKTFLLTALIGIVLAAPAFAASPHHQGDRAVGDMFTRALNNIEASGMLDRLDTHRHVVISNMHINHGQVIMTLEEATGPVIVAYDPIANKILRQDPHAIQP